MVAAVTIRDMRITLGEIIPNVNQIAQFTENKDRATLGMVGCSLGARYKNGSIRIN